MSPIDWNAKATLQQRSDDGSDMFFEFRKVAEGSLVDLVRMVMELPGDDRARVVLDADRLGTIGIYEIIELSRRDDFPG